MALMRFIVSDLHLGDGSTLDDFDQDENFRKFLEEVGERRRAELIINGDFLDFANLKLEKESVRPFSRLGNTEEESLEKLEMILRGHPLVFSSLRSFLEKGHRLVIVPGNHDVDLFWPKVWSRIAEVLGNPGADKLHFEFSGIYRVGGLHVEHGNQYFADSLFANFTHPFLRDPKSGQLRLERSWSNAFLPYFADSMRRKNPFIDNVKPVLPMVLMGIQEESWGFRLKHAYKLANFVLRAGLPPFKEARPAAIGAKRTPEGEENGGKVRRALSLIPGMRRSAAGKELATLEEGGEMRMLEEKTSSLLDIPEEADDLEVFEQAFQRAFAEGGRKEGLDLDPLSTREDALSQRARELLLSPEGIDAVVFGHDHRLYSNQYSPVVGGRKNKFYVNTGTWIPILILTRSRNKLTWKDLSDQRLYQRFLTYAVVRNSRGHALAELRRFA